MLVRSFTIHPLFSFWFAIPQIDDVDSQGRYVGCYGGLHMELSEINETTSGRGERDFIDSIFFLSSFKVVRARENDATSMKSDVINCSLLNSIVWYFSSEM